MNMKYIKRMKNRYLLNEKRKKKSRRYSVDSRYKDYLIIYLECTDRFKKTPPVCMGGDFDGDIVGSVECSKYEYRLRNYIKRSTRVTKIINKIR